MRAALSLSAVLSSFATVQRDEPTRRRAERDFFALHADPFMLLRTSLGRVIDTLSRPRVMILAALVLFAALGPASAMVGAPALVAGSFIARRTFPIAPLPVEGGTSNFTLTRGMLEAGVSIDVLYSVNVTGAGAAVRARSLPIRRISLVGRNTGGSGTTLHVWKAVDLVAFAQIYEQSPIGGLLIPASNFTVANYTALEAHVPLMFNQPSKTINPDMTALPTYAYAELTLVIEWGTISDLLTDGGTRAGAVTFTANGSTVTQLDYADFPIPSVEVGLKIARALPRSIGRYVELVQAAVANQRAEIDLGTSENIRAILLTTELTSTGEPTNTIINKISLQEDNTNYVHTDLPWTTIRADNAKQFGLTMPTGLAVLDFAEDNNAQIDKIYRATQKGKVKLILDTAAVAGTIRAALLGVAPPLNI
jgi:hypothetical protein